MIRDINNEELSKIMDINPPLNLVGKITLLSGDFNLEQPVVFLFDEEHHNDDCLENNLVNAHKLIAKANIGIVGVESHSGGRIWYTSEHSYDEEEYDKGSIDVSPTNTWPNFANRLSESIIYIYGIECYFMQQEINDNIAQKSSQYYGIDITKHPLNKERSKHFIFTLFELRRRNSKNGNLILNCGRDHNTHIAEWIENGEIENITGYQANYIRLNTFE